MVRKGLKMFVMAMALLLASDDGPIRGDEPLLVDFEGGSGWNSVVEVGCPYLPLLDLALDSEVQKELRLDSEARVKLLLLRDAMASARGLAAEETRDPKKYWQDERCD